MKKASFVPGEAKNGGNTGDHKRSVELKRVIEDAVQSMMVRESGRQAEEGGEGEESARDGDRESGVDVTEKRERKEDGVSAVIGKKKKKRGKRGGRKKGAAGQNWEALRKTKAVKRRKERPLPKMKDISAG